MNNQLRLSAAYHAQAEAARRAEPLVGEPPGQGDGCICPEHQPLAYQDCYVVTENCPLHDP